MKQKYNSNTNKKSIFASKGLYIALSLCLVAVGITVFSIIGSPGINKDKELTTIASDDKPARAKATGVEDERKNKTTEPITEKPTQPQTTQPAPFSENIPYQSEFILPLSTDISKDYSNGEIVYSKTTDDWRTHGGIDFSGAMGSEVKAIISGAVIKVYDDTLWGKVVEINHGNGLVAKYCGFKKVRVKAGQTVKQAEPLGTLGEIPIEKAEVIHLHLETSIDGKLCDPLAVMGKAGN